MKAILIPTEKTAVGYYRIKMIAKYLRKLDWEVPNIEPGEISLEELDSLCKGADIIVSQRNGNTQTTAALRAAADINKCPLVIDTDDNFLDIAPSNPAREFLYPGSDQMIAAMLSLHAADAITVSTPRLAEVYADLNANSYVLRNAQDLDDWGFETPKSTDGIVRIGWAGGFSHYDDLKAAWRGVKRALYENKKAEFHVFGFKPDFLMNQTRVIVHPEFIPNEQWRERLCGLQLDIGIAPITNSDFNLCKSSIKWQEYSLADIPTVASSLGEYALSKTAVLTENNEFGWASALNRLIRDPKLRTSIAKASRREVEKHHNIANNIKDWDATYRTIIEQFRSK